MQRTISVLALCLSFFTHAGNGLSYTSNTATQHNRSKNILPLTHTDIPTMHSHYTFHSPELMSLNTHAIDQQTWINLTQKHYGALSDDLISLLKKKNESLLNNTVTMNKHISQLNDLIDIHISEDAFLDFRHVQALKQSIKNYAEVKSLFIKDSMHQAKFLQSVESYKKRLNLILAKQSSAFHLGQFLQKELDSVDPTILKHHRDLVQLNVLKERKIKVLRELNDYKKGMHFIEQIQSATKEQNVSVLSRLKTEVDSLYTTRNKDMLETLSWLKKKYTAENIYKKSNELAQLEAELFKQKNIWNTYFDTPILNDHFLKKRLDALNTIKDELDKPIANLTKRKKLLTQIISLHSQDIMEFRQQNIAELPIKTMHQINNIEHYKRQFFDLFVPDSHTDLAQWSRSMRLKWAVNLQDSYRFFISHITDNFGSTGHEQEIYKTQLKALHHQAHDLIALKDFYLKSSVPERHLTQSPRHIADIIKQYKIQSGLYSSSWYKAIDDIEHNPVKYFDLYDEITEGKLTELFKSKEDMRVLLDKNQSKSTRQLASLNLSENTGFRTSNIFNPQQIEFLNHSAGLRKSLLKKVDTISQLTNAEGSIFTQNIPQQPSIRSADSLFEYPLNSNFKFRIHSVIEHKQGKKDYIIDILPQHDTFDLAKISEKFPHSNLEEQLAPSRYVLKNINDTFDLYDKSQELIQHQQHIAVKFYDITNDIDLRKTRAALTEIYMRLIFSDDYVKDFNKYSKLADLIKHISHDLYAYSLQPSNLYMLNHVNEEMKRFQNISHMVLNSLADYDSSLHQSMLNFEKLSTADKKAYLSHYKTIFDDLEQDILDINGLKLSHKSNDILQAFNALKEIRLKMANANLQDLIDQHIMRDIIGIQSKLITIFSEDTEHDFFTQRQRVQPLKTLEKVNLKKALSHYTDDYLSRLNLADIHGIQYSRDLLLQSLDEKVSFLSSQPHRIEAIRDELDVFLSYHDDQPFLLEAHQDILQERRIDLNRKPLFEYWQFASEKALAFNETYQEFIDSLDTQERAFYDQHILSAPNDRLSTFENKLMLLQSACHHDLQDKAHARRRARRSLKQGIENCSFFSHKNLPSTEESNLKTRRPPQIQSSPHKSQHTYVTSKPTTRPAPNSSIYSDTFIRKGVPAFSQGLLLAFDIAGGIMDVTELAYSIYLLDESRNATHYAEKEKLRAQAIKSLTTTGLMVGYTVGINIAALSGWSFSLGYAALPLLALGGANILGEYMIDWRYEKMDDAAITQLYLHQMYHKYHVMYGNTANLYNIERQKSFGLNVLWFAKDEDVSVKKIDLTGDKIAVIKQTHLHLYKSNQWSRLPSHRYYMKKPSLLLNVGDVMYHTDEEENDQTLYQQGFVADIQPREHADTENVDALILPVSAKYTRDWNRRTIFTLADGIYSQNYQLGARIAKRLEKELYLDRRTWFNDGRHVVHLAQEKQFLPTPFRLELPHRDFDIILPLARRNLTQLHFMQYQLHAPKYQLKDEEGTQHYQFISWFFATADRALNKAVVQVYLSGGHLKTLWNLNLSSTTELSYQLKTQKGQRKLIIFDPRFEHKKMIFNIDDQAQGQILLGHTLFDLSKHHDIEPSLLTELEKIAMTNKLNFEKYDIQDTSHARVDVDMLHTSGVDSVYTLYFSNTSSYGIDIEFEGLAKGQQKIPAQDTQYFQFSTEELKQITRLQYRSMMPSGSYIHTIEPSVLFDHTYNRTVCLSFEGEKVSRALVTPKACDTSRRSHLIEVKPILLGGQDQRNKKDMYQIQHGGNLNYKVLSLDNQSYDMPVHLTLIYKLNHADAKKLADYDATALAIDEQDKRVHHKLVLRQELSTKQEIEISTMSSHDDLRGNRIDLYIPEGAEIISMKAEIKGQLRRQTQLIDLFHAKILKDSKGHAASVQDLYLHKPYTENVYLDFTAHQSLHKSTHDTQFKVERVTYKSRQQSYINEYNLSRHRKETEQQVGLRY
mgnify:CR=1 FL=1